MSESVELHTVGRIARRTGLSVHTIRFWSDIGVVPPTVRSAGGYRLYDAAAVARFDLVRTLRDLGIGLETVQAILTNQVSVAEVAKAHVRALDAEIRTLRLRRAVLNGIAERGGTAEETVMTHRLARLSAAERQRVIDDFVAGIFAGIGPREDALIVAEWMRELPAELPDDPDARQIDAWLELGELVADEGFRARLRRIVLDGVFGPPIEDGFDLRRRVLEEAGHALAGGIAPETAAGGDVLDASSGRTCRRRNGPSCATASGRSPTSRSSATGTCSPSSTAASPARRSSPRSTGSSPPCAPTADPGRGRPAPGRGTSGRSLALRSMPSTTERRRPGSPRGRRRPAS
ncbi:MerR family transcriptional regulator [Sphaerisporangium sp. NPDC005289]|uniref:MerR family transcriptional regulator n=1 Tax=Sphaerisporangium sp. NPDC005289 TaxID=3155247 RepID=UPI0033A6C1B6